MHSMEKWRDPEPLGSAADLRDAAGLLPGGRLANVRPERDDRVLLNAVPGTGSGGTGRTTLQDAPEVGSTCFICSSIESIVVFCLVSWFIHIYRF